MSCRIIGKGIFERARDRLAAREDAISMLVASKLTHSAEETRAVARDLGSRLKAGDFLALYGGLGAGKTVFVSGLVAGMGGNQDDVHSPTFTLVHHYETEPPFFHLDLYRLGSDLEEIEALGFDEYFDAKTGVVAVEWAELAAELFPPRRIEVRIANEGESRRVDIRTVGDFSGDDRWR